MLRDKQNGLATSVAQVNKLIEMLVNVIKRYQNQNTKGPLLDLFKHHCVYVKVFGFKPFPIGYGLDC